MLALPEKTGGESSNIGDFWRVRVHNISTRQYAHDTGIYTPCYQIKTRESVVDDGVFGRNQSESKQSKSMQSVKRKYQENLNSSIFILFPLLKREDGEEIVSIGGNLRKSPT